MSAYTCSPMSQSLATQSPGEFMKSLLEQKNLGYEDLAIITGRSRLSIIDIATGRTKITPETAKILESALNIPANEWLRRDAEYRLSLLNHDTSEVQRRSAIFEAAPVREMQRRGWIPITDDIDQLEAELKVFYETEDLKKTTLFDAVYKRTLTKPELNRAERAWLFRARQLAKVLPAAKFQPEKLDDAVKEMRRVAAYSKEVHRVARILANCGVRFLVIEPLVGTKIDGAAFWLDEQSPVIAVSIRFDNLGSFWFTLFHEISHIRHRDALSLDSELDSNNESTDEVEHRANLEAAGALIDPVELNSFISRVRPLYSKDKIVQFANRIKMHPGIIVGQLQKRGEIPYSQHKQLIPKVRDTAIETALTDGYGKTVPLDI